MSNAKKTSNAPSARNARPDTVHDPLAGVGGQFTSQQFCYNDLELDTSTSTHDNIQCKLGTCFERGHNVSCPNEPLPIADLY